MVCEVFAGVGASETEKDVVFPSGVEEEEGGVGGGGSVFCVHKSHRKYNQIGFEE